MAWRNAPQRYTDKCNGIRWLLKIKGCSNSRKLVTTIQARPGERSSVVFVISHKSAVGISLHVNQKICVSLIFWTAIVAVFIATNIADCYPPPSPSFCQQERHLVVFWIVKIFVVRVDGNDIVIFDPLMILILAKVHFPHVVWFATGVAFFIRA